MPQSLSGISDCLRISLRGTADTSEAGTSAAAIMSCAILELDPDDAGLRNYVNAAVDALAGYMNTDPDCPGLLAATNGTNTYGCYGDYFAMELLARLHGEAAPW